MALKKCRECKQKISNTAFSCPHCGYRKVKHDGPLGWFVGLTSGGRILVLSLVAVFLIIGLLLPDEMGAYVGSQQLVKGQLVSGAAVTFCPYSEADVQDLGEGRFRVAAYFEQDDPTGEVVRTEYVCLLSRDKSGWYLEKLDL
jgi:hypothetical protein